MWLIALRITTILVFFLASRYALSSPGNVDTGYGHRYSRGADVTGPPELKTAVAAYDRGEYSDAYQQFYPLANQGNAEAQYYVGYLHDKFHLGMMQDYTVALQWYRAAAEQGHAGAQMRLGDLYASGRGVPRDIREAARWYQMAKSQSDATSASNTERAQDELQRVDAAQSLGTAIAAYERADYATAFAQFNKLANERSSKPGRRDAAYYQQLAKAQYWLGLLYEKGQGVGQDYKQAAKWYRAASKSGNADAAFNLGALYEHGRGVATDFKQAFDQYAAAEARGNPNAAAAVERLQHQIQHPGDAAGQLSGFDTAVAAYDSMKYDWAIEQFLPLAQAGNADAQLYLGELYDRGRSIDESVQWYRTAAEQGDAEGQHRLSRIYSSNYVDREGRRKWTNYAEAVRWCRAAAEQGHPDAQMDLGRYYREGQGVAKDREEANRWYQIAHKNTEGITLLIEPQCATVAGVAKFTAVYTACNQGDKEGVFQQLTILAKQGNAQAQDWLGYLYYQGLAGIQKRKIYIAGTNHGYFQRAAQLVRTAAEQGYAPAQYNLGIIYEHGMGIAANITEAVRWYKAASRQGIAQAKDALTRLGK